MEKGIFKSLRVGDMISPRDLFNRSWSDVEALCRERVNPVFLGNDRVLSRLLARYKFYSSAGDIGFASHIILDGFWEIWLTSWMVKTIQKDWVVLDVGANYGYYSLLMADLVGRNGRMIAFEPNPFAAKAAEDSLSINGFSSFSEVRRIALSDQEGSCTFFVPEGEPKNGQLVYETLSDRPGEVFEVPITSIDLSTENFSHLDFIKIDAEGGESRIFDGMTKTIHKFNPTILMEFNAARPGASSLCRKISSTYERIYYLKESGSVQEISSENLMSDRFGEDRLLILKM
jgi:FkbM family methyltransferase